MRLRLAIFLTMTLGLLAPSFAGFDFRVQETTNPLAGVGDSSGTFSVFVDHDGGTDVFFNAFEFQIGLLAVTGGASTPVTISGASLGSNSFFISPPGGGMVSLVSPNTATTGGLTQPATGLTLTNNNSFELATFSFSIPNPLQEGQGFELGITEGRLLAEGFPTTLPNGIGTTAVIGVPEPSSAIVLGLLGGALCLRRRKS